MQKRSNSKKLRECAKLSVLELSDNACNAQEGTTETNIMENNTTVDTAATPKRSKTNYDLVMGAILVAIQKKPGTTIPELHAEFGQTDTNPTGHKTPVVYQTIRNLKKRGAIFGTGAKKNEGLYLTKEDADANKPAETERPQRKKDQPFTLEKKMPKGNWWAIEGNNDQKPIDAAYDLATTVPGSIFRVVDNTGDSPNVLRTNEAPAPAAKASKSSKKADKSEKSEETVTA